MRRVFAICLLFAAALLVAPPQAHAAGGTYSIDELSTQITVEPNATTHIIEHQVLTFESANEGVTWYLHVPEDGESVRISSVRVAPVDDGGTLLGAWTRLQMIDSAPDRQGRNPGNTASYQLRTDRTQPWYSYNIGDGMVRCWFPLESSEGEGSEGGAEGEGSAEGEGGAGSRAADGSPEPHRTYAIEIDYTIAHRVRVYRDVAELYWRYVNDSLPADADNVNLQVTLPIPDDLTLEAARSEITAWGHGPTDGRFAIGDDGAVTYHIDHIASGNYAEAHIVFPADWETSVPDNGLNQFSELRRSSAEAEESKWVDLGMRGAAWDNKVRLLFLAFGLAIIAFTAISVIRHGRTPRSRRTLIRAAATFGIVALGAQLFFREPLTTNTLALCALAAVLLALAFPVGPIGPISSIDSPEPEVDGAPDERDVDVEPETEAETEAETDAEEDHS